MRPKRVRQLLASRNDARLGFQAHQQLVHHFCERRRRGMDYHVGGLLQHFLGFRGNDYAPGSILCSDNFAQVAPDFRGIGIDGADNFNGLFFPHQPRDRGPDRAHTILNGANFLFHVALRFPFACAHIAQFGFKGNPYDNGISPRIQRRTAASVRAAGGARHRDRNSCGVIACAA